MAFTSTSKYVQLTPFLLMEYMYADEPNPERYPVNSGSTTVGFDKLVNNYIKQNNGVSFAPTNQIFNPPVDDSITHNTNKSSVVQFTTSSFITLDPELIIPFNDFTSELTPTIDLPIVFPSNILVMYDSVRYHIAAGYNLSNLDGVIVNIKYQDHDSTYVTFSQIIIQKGTQQTYNFNPTPIKIGTNIYDRYLEVKIPSLRDMNDRYQAASTTFRGETLAALTSNSGKGFIYAAPIRFEVWYVRNKTDYNGYEKYEAEQSSVFSLESEDPFSNIGATIKEADNGQFFEYFATDNEGFVEDFILFQNSIGNSYYILHQIETLEQIGEAFILTNTFQTIQTTGYDVPNYYRPIVKNPQTAVSFTLRYTMSLVNNVDKSSVIRIGTYTSSTPSMWGPNIQPIQLSNFPQTQKIYNRIYSQTEISNPPSEQPEPIEIVKYKNVFIDQNEVSSTNIPLLIRANTIQEDSSAQPAIAQPKGKMYIDMTPFDNFYKFKFYKSGADGDPVAIDLGNTANFKMAFIDNKGVKTYIPSLNDRNIANPTLGEVAFRIDDSISVKILKFSDRRFFIVDGGDNEVVEN